MPHQFTAGTHNYDCSKESLIKWFKERNQRIQEECLKEKLLVFEAKDGWEPLCKHLGVPIPDVSYPHENDTAHMQKIHMALNLVDYTVLVVAIATVIGVEYFASTMIGKMAFEKDL